jgi:hypothetical protein
MASGMKRLFALITLVIALVAISAPSLAMGSRGWISDPVPVVTVQPGGSHVRGPCLFTGGKVLSPCRPDLGVMPALVLLVPPAEALPVPPMADAMPSSVVTEPGLPPPRRA